MSSLISIAGRFSSSLLSTRSEQGCRHRQVRLSVVLSGPLPIGRYNIPPIAYPSYDTNTLLFSNSTSSGGDGIGDYSSLGQLAFSQQHVSVDTLLFINPQSRRISRRSISWFSFHHLYLLSSSRYYLDISIHVAFVFVLIFLYVLYENIDYAFEDIHFTFLLPAFSADVSYADRLEALVEPSGGIALLLPAAVDDGDAAEAVRLSFLRACATAEPDTLRGQIFFPQYYSDNKYI